MANKMPISGAAAGTIGSPYVAKVSSPNVPVGSYLVNNTNFPGIGAHIPCWALIVGTANLSLSVSTDNGATAYVALSQTGGGWAYLDSGSTVKIVIASTNVSVSIFPMDAS